MAWGWEKAPEHRGEKLSGQQNGATGRGKDELDTADREGSDRHFSFGCLDKQKFLIGFCSFC